MFKSNDEIGKSYYQTPYTKVPIKFRTTNTTLTTRTHHLTCPDWYKCLNGGICVIDLVTGPKCLCTAEFEGLNCGKGIC